VSPTDTEPDSIPGELPSEMIPDEEAITEIIEETEITKYTEPEIPTTQEGEVVDEANGSNGLCLEKDERTPSTSDLLVEVSTSNEEEEARLSKEVAEEARRKAEKRKSDDLMRLQAVKEASLRAEAEAEEAARLKAEDEARKAEADAFLKAEEARRMAVEESQRKKEEEKRIKDDEARQKAQQNASRKLHNAPPPSTAGASIKHKLTKAGAVDLVSVILSICQGAISWSRP